MLARREGAMKKKTYTAAPAVPEELRERYETMLAVMSGAISVSEGARRLGMARNHFQTLMHRGLSGMMDGISPGAPGRPAKPEKQAELESEVEKLRRENARLKEQAQMIDRVMSVVGGMIRDGAQREPRGRRSKKTKDDGDKDEEPDPRIALIEALRGAGLSVRDAAQAVGVSHATARRWIARRHGETAKRRSRAARVTSERAASVRSRVRATHGLIGAAALRHAVPGVSRRQAAALKRDELTAMERERIAACQRVSVTTPGVLRGFDAMHIATQRGAVWLLIACDGAVPYRTSVHAAVRYDGASVAHVLAPEFDENGAPLVLRLDRASMHATPDVRDVCARFGVLVLHGPAYYPPYYGQLERQNRDHRAWLRASKPATTEALARTADAMKHALNTLWPRRKLQWQTPLEAWNARLTVEDDRAELGREVRERAARLIAENHDGRMTTDLAERLAIERALVKRNYLRCEMGVGC